jgi:hypothetical protein
MTKSAVFDLFEWATMARHADILSFKPIRRITAAMPLSSLMSKVNFISSGWSC